MTDYPNFVESYVEGFRRKLVQTREAYLSRRSAFDNLFQDRPSDTNGSGAYRWACILRRLENCDPQVVVDTLKAAVAC